MQNPFESGHIKNYILLYSSVVVIMVLFFIASTLFNDIKPVEKKEFQIQSDKEISDEREKKGLDNNSSGFKFKLLKQAY
jgi:hypothetical protein